MTISGPLLAIDTAIAQCAVAVLDGDGVATVLAEPMTRGHAERLPLMVREALVTANVAAAELARVAAVTGPGSFTGVRVGLSFARGLALASQADAVGVSSLEALAWSAEAPGDDEVVASVLDARRGEVYAQAFDPRTGKALCAPMIAPVDEAARRLADAAGARRLQLIGTGADLLSMHAEETGLNVRRAAPDAIDPVNFARRAIGLPPQPDGPRALYVRGPDATPPAPSPFAPLPAGS